MDDDFLRGADAIAAAAGEMFVGGPKPTPKHIYDWIARGKISGGKLGADIITTRTQLRADLLRAAQGGAVKQLNSVERRGRSRPCKGAAA